MRTILSMLALATAMAAVPASGRENASLQRVDAATVELTMEGGVPVSVWLSRDTILDPADTPVAAASKGGKVTLPLEAGARQFVIVKGKDGAARVAAERVLPLAQASNFRDIGGYVTKDGKTVRWGKAFRSGAMPLLTDADYAYIRQLGIATDVDLRSSDERQFLPDDIDDRLPALFVSNDYRMADLMKGFMAGKGENIYAGMEVRLAPQYRAIYRRIMADDGAVLYHCSAGQDRTGVATALLYDMLGVDRETILKDYHLSTALRRTEWEMVPINPADFPGNQIAAFFARSAGEARPAEPLYTASGASHLVQFFAHLDQTYGGSEGYMKQVLGFQDTDLARLRAVMLD